MATKQFYAARDFKYGTRMLRAGDPVEMTGPHAKLYTALNAITTAKPKAKAEIVESATHYGNGLGNKPTVEVDKPKRKAAARKKAPAKK